MARTEILAGLSLGTERPYLDKRFADLSNLSNDFGGEKKLIGIAYDPRHKNPSLLSLLSNPVFVDKCKNKKKETNIL